MGFGDLRADDESKRHVQRVVDLAALPTDRRRVSLMDVGHRDGARNKCEE